jgi:3-deoxy-D-manno-octulosonic-acid transferase
MDRFLADEDYLKAQGQLAGHFVKGQAGATQEVLSSITL